MKTSHGLRASISALAFVVATAAQAQTAPADPATPAAAAAPQGATDDQGAEIVVTGLRQSLERAAAIKRDAAQVVDSIVAEDIGKFPDPTTAAALQRVPGVQTTVGANNEITGVVIRGLADILSTLDGREVFSGTGRGFALQDLPAVALSRVDVIKSSTANLIEGGIAGITDLQLNKPFNFRKPTVIATGRMNYSANPKKGNPQLGMLATDRWDTGIGEIGALVNVSYAYFDYLRPISFVAEQRSLTAAPYNIPGIIGRNTVGGSSDYGWYERPQVNAALQWQASPELEVYADGLFTGYKSDYQSAFIASAQFFPESTAANLQTDPDQCFTTRVRADGYSPSRAEVAAGNFTVQQVCNLTSGTFNNVRALTSSQARYQASYNYLGAGGFKWKSGPDSILFDASYQKSTTDMEAVIVDVGKRITVNIQTDVDQGGIQTHPGNPLGNPAGFFLRNGLNQNFQRIDSDLKQVRLDGTHEFDGALGFLDKLQAGMRYAERSAVFKQGILNRAVADLTVPVAGNLPAGFLIAAPGISRINGGAAFLIPDPDYLRSDAGRDVLRALYGVPLGDVPFQRERQFDANEKTFASYVQLGYKFDLGGPIVVDGLIGVRPTRTERSIAGAGLVSGVIVPANAKTTDTDILPNASMRVQFGGGLQARATYAKAIRRPDFASLNPGVNYTLATNPAVQNGGTAGNPDLRPQKSESFDATLEYYWGSNFLAVAGFYRDLKDRVITSANAELIDGLIYNISRPRNVGALTLKGVEVSGQTFLDFLPGALSGIGLSGNFTYVDSNTGRGSAVLPDPLAGFPIQGVSKYNYNAGLIYEKYGLSGRLVYTYRSKYYDGDNTGTTILRPVDPARVNDRTYYPTTLNYVRPGGRLDFSVGYDIDANYRIDVGGTNILRNKYKSYFDLDYLNRDYREDDAIYTIGLRARF